MTDKLSERLETLVRNACPGWHAAETIREAAELARRVEGAPEGRLDIWQNDCDEQGAVEIVMDADTVRHLIHRRVRIVPVDGGKAGQEAKT